MTEKCSECKKVIKDESPKYSNRKVYCGDCFSRKQVKDKAERRAHKRIDEIREDCIICEGIIPRGLKGTMRERRSYSNITCCRKCSRALTRVVRHISSALKNQIIKNMEFDNNLKRMVVKSSK